MNGTYNITLITPFGPQKGTVVFTDCNGVLSGSIHALGDTSYFKGGKTGDNSFDFSGTLNTGFFTIRYAANGTAEGNILNGSVKTNLGTFQIRGEKA